MNFGLTVLYIKNHEKSNSAENYQPIMCLSLMWKLLTVMITDKMHNYAKKEQLIFDGQKGCRIGSRGTTEQLLTGKNVLKY